jgi:hypothetical protein
VLAYFDRPGTSNGPTEAINGRLGHPRGSASASATSPTTSPDPYSKPAASDLSYTPTILTPSSTTSEAEAYRWAAGDDQDHDNHDEPVQGNERDHGE